MADEKPTAGQSLGHLRDTDPTKNPSNDVYVVSTGIHPDLAGQSEAEAALAADPPKDQVPALNPGSDDSKAQEEADAARRARIEGAVQDGKEEDENDDSSK